MRNPSRLLSLGLFVIIAALSSCSQRPESQDVASNVEELDTTIYRPVDTVPAHAPHDYDAINKRLPHYTTDDLDAMVDYLDDYAAYITSHYDPMMEHSEFRALLREAEEKHPYFFKFRDILAKEGRITIEE